jgi:hypothetical protein
MLLYAFLLFNSFDQKNCEASLDKKITVVGTALNAKAGAIVENDKHSYFVFGLNEWDERFYGKKVKVTGRLVIKENKGSSSYPGEFAEWKGKMFVLKNARWGLVE